MLNMFNRLLGMMFGVCLVAIFGVAGCGDTGGEGGGPPRGPAPITVDPNAPQEEQTTVDPKTGKKVATPAAAPPPKLVD